MAQFKEQFGLDYLAGTAALKKSPSSPRSSSFSPGMDEALITYGGKLLELLQKRGPSKTFDLAKELVRRVDELGWLVNYFVDKGYVERSEVDSLGNDTLRLTEQGRKVLGV